MLEEYLDGPEVDVDLVFSEGAAGEHTMAGQQFWTTIKTFSIVAQQSNCQQCYAPLMDQQLAPVSLFVIGLSELHMSQE